MSLLNQWENAVELSFAHVEFADPYQLGKFRATKSFGAFETIKRLMVADTFALLQNGELQAFGFQIGPTLSDGPVPIPAHCFMQQPNFEECDVDIISASGWRYERVRIAKSSNSDDFDIPEAAPFFDKGNKSGRPSKYAQAAETLAALVSEDGRYIDQSAEALHERFNAKYREMNQIAGIPIAPVAVRSLRNYLNRFRQESAKMGRNNSTN